jgi:hypothetical protein
MRFQLVRRGHLLGGRAHLEERHDGSDVIADASAWAGSEADPCNHLLGLRREEAYLNWLANEWRALRRFVRTADLERWLDDGTVETLIGAAERVREGIIPFATLAPLLERIRFATAPPSGQGRGAADLSVGVLDAPDLPTLAAWSLQHIAQTGRYRVVTCPICERPWFQDSRAVRSECYRPAPGRETTCSQVAASDRFTKRQADWMKEYRRIYARKLRGTVSEDDWAAWMEFTRATRAESGDSSRFTRFDDWINHVEGESERGKKRREKGGG